MGRQISRRELRLGVLQGIADAYRAHRRTSRRRFGQAPEYWVTTMIARRLAKIAPQCGVELEASVRDIMVAARAIKPGVSPASLRIGGRFDVVLWWKSRAAPRALIEVKHPVRRSHINAVLADVQRIMTALRRGAKEKLLEWGCVAFFCHTGPHETLQGAPSRIKNTLEALNDRVQKLARKKGFRATLRQGNVLKDHDAARKQPRYGRACCITIRRRSESA